MSAVKNSVEGSGEGSGEGVVSLRIAGHGLVEGGRPHDATGQRSRDDHGRLVYDGPGRAKCQCGQLSEVLDTYAARQGWHREHKAALAAAGAPATATTMRPFRLQVLHAGRWRADGTFATLQAAQQGLQLAAQQRRGVERLRIVDARTREVVHQQ